MAVQKFNISKPEKYISNGVEKTFWANVGTVTEFTKDDGSTSRILEIPAIGLKANIFPATPKESQPKTKNDDVHVPMVEGMEYPEDDINPEDIPF